MRRAGTSCDGVTRQPAMRIAYPDSARAPRCSVSPLAPLLRSAARYLNAQHAIILATPPLCDPGRRGDQALGDKPPIGARPRLLPTTSTQAATVKVGRRWQMRRNGSCGARDRRSFAMTEACPPPDRRLTGFGPDPLWFCDGHLEIGCRDLRSVSTCAIVLLKEASASSRTWVKSLSNIACAI